MSRTNVNTAGRGNPLDIVSSLRTAVETGSPDLLNKVATRLDAVQASVQRVLVEHSGMADELLRVYEQLGIVFEVTRELSGVRNEKEVLYLFVQSLQTTYPHAIVTAARPHGGDENLRLDEDLTLPGWVWEAMVQCRKERRVVVADHPDCAGVDAFPVMPVSGEPLYDDGSFVRVMCGPIFAGEELAAVLLLGHGATSSNEQARTFDASDMLLLESLNLFCGDMIRNFRLVDELRQLSVDMVRVLVSAIEQKDPYTSGHSNRVGQYSVLLGSEFGLTAEELQMLEWAALLHDIGKIGIRDDVLKKPGRLSDEEFEHIKEHPVRSYHVVRQVPQLTAALDGVAHHHEHWDGSGYPDGLAGEEIPLQARLIQVADIFDALTSTRSYRKAFDWSKALSILEQEAGKTVDPKISSVFSRMIRRMADDEPERLWDIMSDKRSADDPEDWEHTPIQPASNERGG